MSIPLVRNNTKDAINTSIIAIKKNLERINSLLGLVDSGSDIDTSEFVKKSDIVDVVQSGNMNPVTSNAVTTSNAMPVDTVTSGNMHSVTSNAVYSELFKLLIGENNDPDNFPIDAMRVYKVRDYNIGWGANDGFIINLPWSDRFIRQIALDDQSNFMAVRAKNQGTWGNWENIVVAKTTVEDYTPKSYLDRVVFTNNGNKVYKVGNHIKLHIDVTVSQVNVTTGKFAFDITDFTLTSYPLAIYFMDGVSGIGLTDSPNNSGLVWLKDYSGNELNCTSLLNKRIFAEIDFFV